ncbi:MAG: YkgJ family cysteine cluster protein [Candidatus Hydrogenedentes bacterium]|nr:YkgJ family cysteine cluster protein [Candidatus Hydrogenedentota bacterium]
MGRDSVQFQCHHCGHCCTEVVCLPTPWDVVRIVRDTGFNPYDFLEFLTPDEITGVDEGDPSWLSVGGERYMMALRRDAKGCFFLDKKTRYCSIYESRPILCRLYPFKLEETRDGAFKGFSLHTDVGCPRNRDGKVETAPLYALYLEDSGHHSDYDDLVEVFNRDAYSGKKPEDFIELFVEVPKKHRKRHEKGEVSPKLAIRE